MNYTPKSYAMAFCFAIADAKNKSDEARCIKNLLALTEVNRDQKKLKEIFSAVEKKVSRKMGYRKITIESARPLSPANKKTVKHFIKSNDIIEEKIDNRLIAGIKLNIDDEFLLDGSFAAKIKNILS